MSEHNLYIVRSQLPKLDYQGTRYNNVPLTWFRIRRREPFVPYEEGIEGYSELIESTNLKMAEMALDEFFTFEEAQTPYGHILESYQQKAQVWEVSLPIPPMTAALELVSVGSVEGFFRPEPNLGFQVEAFFYLTEDMLDDGEVMPEPHVRYFDQPYWPLPLDLVAVLHDVGETERGDLSTDARQSSMHGAK